MSNPSFRQETEKSLNEVLSGDGERIFSCPVKIVVSPKLAHSKQGQVLLHGLVSQLARLSRNVELEGLTDSPLFIGSVLGENTILTECDAILRAFSALNVHGRKPIVVYVGAEAAQIEPGIYTGIGSAGAFVSSTFRKSDFDDGNCWDSALASCLCASAFTKNILFGEMNDQQMSFRQLLLGASDPLDSANLKRLRLLMLGFGAIGSNFLYWSHLLKLGLNPTIVEGDKVEAGNASRSLLFYPLHCTAGKAWQKVQVAKLIDPSLNVIDAFFDENLQIEGRFDIALCLANERNVRERVSQLNTGPLTSFR